MFILCIIRLIFGAHLLLLVLGDKEAHHWLKSSRK